jgi:hypothetical protein
MSYGVNDMRDGVNLSRMQVTRPLVMHTEVTNLPNLCGYLRFGRNLPVVRLQDSYNREPSISAAFEERLTPPVRMAIDPAVPPEPPIETEKAPPPRPSRRRRARTDEAGPELPLTSPPSTTVQEEAPATDESAPASPTTPKDDFEPPVTAPQLSLYGKPTAFGLRQHGRRDGARNSAEPA